MTPLLVKRDYRNCSKSRLSKTNYNNNYFIGSQVAADGECERDVVHIMNEGYKAWAAPKSVLSNRGLGIKAKSVY